MAIRQFIDASGLEWSVYDIVPREEERRRHERRDLGHAEEDSSAERRADDRRATISTSRPVRITRGWLCFESTGGERRRLQPIPDKWHQLEDADLVQLLERARVAPRRLQADRATVSRS